MPRFRSTYTKNTLQVFAFFALMQLASAAGESKKFTGRIVDEFGKPVENVTVAESWKSITPDTTTGVDRPAIPLGPITEPLTVSNQAGEFSLEIEGSKLGMLALDSSGERGAIAFLHDLAKTPGKEIRMSRLTQIAFRLPKSFESRQIDRMYLTVSLEDVDSQPLADTRLLYITDVREECRLKLPSGSYRLELTAITTGSPALELSLADRVHFKVEEQTQLDLGELPLRIFTDPVLEYARKVRDLRIRQASNESESRDNLFGKIAPNWISIDGSGIDHHANIESLRGKWVFLQFWGLYCGTCLEEKVPGLIDFYKRNESHRDRFEVIGLFLDLSGKIDSVDSLEEKLEPIRKHVWGGRAIPFPIVLGNTFSNWERYAIQGLGDYLLIDPEGRMVRGDLETLQQILDSGER